MGMKFSKFMGCYDFLGLWGFYEFFFFFGIFGVVCVMLCSELGIFIALAFVKMPWMMTGDCGWATIFYLFIFFFKEQIDGEFWYQKKKLHRVASMGPTNSVKNIK